MDVNEITLAPKTNLRKDVCKRIDSEIDGFPWDSVVDLEMEIVERDFSIRINDSFDSEGEDIFGRLVGGNDFKFSEQRAFLLESCTKS